MQCDSGNYAELRKALNLEGVANDEHPRRVDALKALYSHGIVCIENPHEFTCGTYALGLGDNATYREIASTYRAVFAGRTFITWLQERHLVELREPAVGSLAMYFAGNVWQHVGVVYGENLVRSKWGTFPVYDHGTFEVPSTYGDSVRFFERPSPETVLERFLEYARACGVRAG